MYVTFFVIKSSREPNRTIASRRFLILDNAVYSCPCVKTSCIKSTPTRSKVKPWQPWKVEWRLWVAETTHPLSILPSLTILERLFRGGGIGLITFELWAGCNMKRRTTSASAAASGILAEITWSMSSGVIHSLEYFKRICSVCGRFCNVYWRAWYYEEYIRAHAENRTARSTR